jgi:hypothetical protein
LELRVHKGYKVFKAFLVLLVFKVQQVLKAILGFLVFKVHKVYQDLLGLLAIWEQLAQWVHKAILGCQVLREILAHKVLLV